MIRINKLILKNFLNGAETIHKEKYLRNLIKSNENQIVYTIFRLICLPPLTVVLIQAHKFTQDSREINSNQIILIIFRLISYQIQSFQITIGIKFYSKF